LYFRNGLSLRNHDACITDNLFGVAACFAGIGVAHQLCLCRAEAKRCDQGDGGGHYAAHAYPVVCHGFV